MTPWKCFLKMQMSCPVHCLRAGRAFWHLCATPAPQWGRISPWTSTFPMGPFPSWSVILLIIVNATISSESRSDAWSVVPKIPSRCRGKPQPSDTMATCNSVWNILASSYAISWLSSLRVFGRMPSYLGDMLTSHLPLWSNGPLYFLLADLTPLLICCKEWGQVWKSSQYLQQ